MLDAGDLAVLILSGFWALLVLFLCWVLVRLGQAIRATGELIVGVTDKTIPLLGEMTTSVGHVNVELDRIDAITAHAQTITSNVAGLTTLFSATLGGPLVKVAAFSYGVRRAAGRREKDEIAKRVKQEMKAAKKR